MAERFLKSKTMWELVWEVPPTPPIHPRTMRGYQTFLTMGEALTFFDKATEGTKLISLTMVIEERKDFTEDALKRVHKYKEMKSC